MTDRLQYGTTAKVFHWLVLALLLVQYPLGWLMPDIHRGDKPGAAMSFHISLGIVILLLIVAARVAAHASRGPGQLASTMATADLGGHALASLWLVLATTITGWLFASFRGWSMSLFYLVPLPMLASDNAAAGKAIDGWHQAMEWTLLVVIGLHVAAALAHLFIYRDRIMQRMLPG